MGLSESTVRGMDLRYLERCEANRRKPVLRQMGVDEIYQGKKDKFLTVACNLETGEPLWFGRERKQETLDEYFRGELSSRQRGRIEAACVDMWEPFRMSIEAWASSFWRFSGFSRSSACDARTRITAPAFALLGAEGATKTRQTPARQGQAAE